MKQKHHILSQNSLNTLLNVLPSSSLYSRGSQMRKKKKKQRDNFFYGIKIIWDICAEFDTRRLFLCKIFSVLT